MSDDLSRNSSEYDHEPSTSGVATRNSSSPEIITFSAINSLEIKNDNIQEITRRSVTPSDITKPSGSNKEKTSKSDLNSSGINVSCSEQNIVKSPIDLKSSMLKSLYLSNTVKIVSKDVVIADCNKGKKSRKEGNSIKKNTQKVSSLVINNDDSSSRMETDVDIDIVNMNINSPICIEEESNDSLNSTSTTIMVPNLVMSTPETNNRVKRNSNNYLLPSTSNCDMSPGKSQSGSKDTACITIPSILEIGDPSYSFIVSDSKIQDFIKNAKMMEPDDADYAFDPTEIDEIIDHEVILGTRYYLVKWKKWSKGFNTWERFGALYKSQKHLHKYIKNLKTDKDVNSCKHINGIELMMSRKVISNLFDLFRTETGLSLPAILPEHIIGLFNCLDVGPTRSQALRIKTFQSYLTTIALGYFRQQQLIKLKQWEIDINVVTQGYQIKVENNMDLEGPPDLFVYVSNYVPQKNIIIPDDPPIGCSCRRNCQSPEECCYEMSGCLKAYDKNKNLVVVPGSPIFECNKKCRCTKSCTNRVVQLGSNVNICIYKTRKYGWGVKSAQNIQKGQFVGKYIGEIITVKESEQRLSKRTSSLDNMWNLDFNDPLNYKYIIDGTHYANFTYFINHSCDANLNVYAVWINCLDRNLPELALFASRDILAGEQLTTDYFSRISEENTLKKNGTKCQCDMKNCQGYYF
ncbi:histone-lysine N-methyltransferase SUV39H2-like [Myzus persicae]|uniref:histone-lysine N-methyltransferase SUV39H2-like n=1 Tax=Myzus persicae TaxID=13164 RepID=UPI000B92FE2A|nr:histone-lysine N-methyltransferase SUV39H2-like [Myzus persicae]XP_022173481.1 histone-lysine N-methyltransferase SUV39H2-like [Myzus persicae]XP_022173482.1 histone-lysine N-methyltransferase SUV39H2-like [Myzus persicae]XP_022173483.1 histone-lysine N-methyltransferase SUV39H2-like [Myzus persicae]XP_022173484.1 histone-lysine N-methyltransferase SUV39H2-like [Myzus persicae]